MSTKYAINSRTPFRSLAVGIVAAVALGGAAEAAEVFPRLAAGEMRGRLLRFAEGFAVINDSYNSNPVALQAMIELLAQTPGYSRRILAAGEMLELGPQSAQLHRESGHQAAAAKKIDWVFGVQGQASKIVGGAVEAGLSASHARFFPNSADAAAFLAEMLQPGDLLLVKGSRGVKMERIVEALREQYAPAGDLQAGPAAQQGRG